MENFKQKFIDTAYSKFGVKANGSINFEQAFEIIDEIEQYKQLVCDHEWIHNTHSNTKYCRKGCDGFKIHKMI